MRKVVCYALLLVFLPAHADDSQHYQDWLAFKKAFAEEVGGPTGIYAIQDMLELDAGESAYVIGRCRRLALGQDRSAGDDRASAVQRRPGTDPRTCIKERDLLKPIGEALALPNGLTVRGTLCARKS